MHMILDKYLFVSLTQQRSLYLEKYINIELSKFVYVAFSPFNSLILETRIISSLLS